MKATIAALLLNATYGTPPACNPNPPYFADDGRGEMVRITSDGIEGIEWKCDFTGVSGNRIDATAASKAPR